MKINIFIPVVMILSILGCQKETDNIYSTLEFNYVNKKILDYLNVLDSVYFAKEEKVKILCTSYPHLYRYEYIPALLKVVPEKYNKESLLNELDFTMQYYQDKLRIDCHHLIVNKAITS